MFPPAIENHLDFSSTLDEPFAIDIAIMKANDKGIMQIINESPIVLMLFVAGIITDALGVP